VVPTSCCIAETQQNIRAYSSAFVVSPPKIFLEPRRRDQVQATSMQAGFAAFEALKS